MRIGSSRRGARQAVRVASLVSVLCATGCRALLGFETPVVVSVEDAAVDAPIPDVSIDGPPPNFKLRIESLIDGRSQLIVHRSTVQWQHFEFAAPGREGGVNEATLLDGVPWFPTWPDIPTAENRDCNGCLSSTTTVSGSVPTLPATTTTLTEIQVRRPQTVVQAPTAANDYTLVVELSDLGFPNASTVIVEVAVTIN